MCDRSTSPPNGEGTEKQDENKKRHHVALYTTIKYRLLVCATKMCTASSRPPFFYTVWSSLIEKFWLKSKNPIFSGI